MMSLVLHNHVSQPQVPMTKVIRHWGVFLRYQCQHYTDGSRCCVCMYVSFGQGSNVLWTHTL